VSAKDLILGIETSCDETAAAVVDRQGAVASNVVASQLDVHARYGGVVPELASREHLRAIVIVVREALQRAGATVDELAAIGVTEGPGLAGALLVGITYAKALSFASGRPLVAVNHLEGHIHAVLLEAAQAGSPVTYPLVALVVSGGHSHLYEVSEPGRYRVAGQTRDDAAGEAYDKVAKLLGFGYPGGPVIDQLAKFGDPLGVRFSLANIKSNPMDLSFSGLKTAVLRWVEAQDLTAEIDVRRRMAASRPALEQWLAATPQPTLDLLASFQRTVLEELLSRVERLARDRGIGTALVTGGVAANQALREQAARLTGLRVLFPSRALSTDNAAMIAAAAWPKFDRGLFAPLTLGANPGLTLGH
jgi:N6-L-threonylcarbamoyladenine synthase